MDKRYIVFVYENAGANGGWHDKHGEASTVPEAKDMLELACQEGKAGHVIDWVSRRQVAEYPRGHRDHD